jgi:hypothetical protein
MSQNEMILAYLERNGSITQAEAMNALGCYRLGCADMGTEAAGGQDQKIYGRRAEQVWNKNKICAVHPSGGRRWSIT